MIHNPRRAVVAAVLLAMSLTISLSGCVGEISAPLKACSPSYDVNSQFGRFTVQQAGRGHVISWGAYPDQQYSGTTYLVSVYAGGVKIDGKNQFYAPHGSVSAARALKYSGQILKINGTVLRGKDTRLVFEMECVIA